MITDFTRRGGAERTPRPYSAQMLHCPATLLLTGIPRLPEHDDVPADVLDEISQGARLLVLSRVAALYHSPDHPSTACADVAASVLGLRPILVPDLEAPVGVDPAVKHRTSWTGEALQNLADVHRGESVLVIAPHDTFQGARITMRSARRAVSVLAAAAASRTGAVGGPQSGRTALVEAAPPEDMSGLFIAALAIGDDGWFLAPWPGT